MRKSINIKNILKKIKTHPQIMIGGIIVIIAIVGAILAPLLSKFNPIEVSGKDRLLPPSMLHFMGTDQFGRDVFSRLLFGARISIKIGFSVVILSTLLGGFLGIIAGYYKKMDNVIMRIIDGFMAFPGIIIAITLCAIWGAGSINIILALSFAYFPPIARVVRSCVISVKEWECVEAAKAIGAKDWYIIYKYILMNSLSPIIVQSTFTFAAAILDEAALSFLGVGIEAPNPSWGIMIT